MTTLIKILVAGLVATGAITLLMLGHLVFGAVLGGFFSTQRATVAHPLAWSVLPRQACPLEWAP